MPIVPFDKSRANANDGGGMQTVGISKRQQDSWQRRLQGAESDDDIKALRDSLRRKGVDPDSYPALQMDPQKGSQRGPSETDYLLALAEMHRQGRFETAMDYSKFRRSTNIEDTRGQKPPEEPLLEYKMELKDITTPRDKAPKDKG